MILLLISSLIAEILKQLFSAGAIGEPSLPGRCQVGTSQVGLTPGRVKRIFSNPDANLTDTFPKIRKIAQSAVLFYFQT